MRRLLPTLLAALAVLPGPLAAQEDSLKIAVMVDLLPAEIQTLFNQMRSEITAVVGTVIDLTPDDVYPSGFDAAQAGDIYETLIAGGTDMIFAFGPVTAAVVAERESYPVPTVIFGGVNRDLLELPEPGATSGIPNFTYQITPESYERDLRTFKELYDFQRIGIVLPPGPTAAFDLENRLAGLMGELGVDFEVIPYESVQSLAPQLEDVDAIYLLETIFISDAEVRELAALFIERGLPSFSGTRRDDVDFGIMATNQPVGGLGTFFRRLALLVESVVEGEDLADAPIYLDGGQTLTVNFTTAQAVGVSIRFSLITTTEFVGDYVNPLAERVYSLRDLVEEALRTNLSLESGRRSVRIAEQDSRASWSNYLPSVSASMTQSVLDSDIAAASGGANPQYSTLGKLSLNQAVLSPDVNAAVGIQRELLAAQRATLQASEWDIILDAANAYFTALILKANVEIQNRNLAVTKQNLAIAEQSFAAGQSGRGDVLRLQSEAARDMQSLVDAVNRLESSFYAINQVVNQPISREIDVLDMTMEQGAFVDENFDQIRTLLDDPAQRLPFEDWLVLESLTTAPELRVLQHNIDAVGRRARLDGYERFIPTVALGLDLNRTIDQSGIGAPPAGASIGQYFSLGISASIPLFDSNQRRISRQTSLIQQDQLQVDRRGLEESLERAVRDVVLELTSDIASLGLTAISEEAAAEGLELAQGSFASGAVTVVELLDAQTNYLQAQLSRASVRYEFLATSVALQRLVGHFYLLNSDAVNAEFMGRFQQYLMTRSPEERP